MTRRILSTTNADGDELEQLIEIMPFEDMLRVIFAAAFIAYESDYLYLAAENIIDKDIFDAVVDTVSKPAHHDPDAITSPTKRARLL